MADIADQAYRDENCDIENSINEALEEPVGCEQGPDWEENVPHCRNCGKIIPSVRMHAVPCTGLCVECATKAQEGDQQGYREAGENKSGNGTGYRPQPRA